MIYLAFVPHDVKINLGLNCLSEEVSAYRPADAVFSKYFQWDIDILLISIPDGTCIKKARFPHTFISCNKVYVHRRMNVDDWIRDTRLDVEIKKNISCPVFISITQQIRAPEDEDFLCEAIEDNFLVFYDIDRPTDRMRDAYHVSRERYSDYVRKTNSERLSISVS